MSIHSRSEGPRLYARISSDLEAKIAVGHHALGSRLPSERELAQAYRVSRPTIREAIIALEVDGLVEVRVGSGVYVVERHPRGGGAEDTDIGPFELLEARKAIEGEACALAAVGITGEELATLVAYVDAMAAENALDDIVRSEVADRHFHMLIAKATRNSAMISAVETLWDARARSPQTRKLSSKAHSAGVKPRIDEHMAIVEALRAHDGPAAREAMRSHIGRVLETLLEATEVHEIEQARARVEEHRLRFARDV